MLYMIIVKASNLSESETAPSKELMSQMDLYNDLLENAGIKIMAKGLHPTKEAKRISFIDGKKYMTQGPFLPATEQIAGFFLIDVKSEEEAMLWFDKAPDPIGSHQGVIELRKVY